MSVYDFFRDQGSVIGGALAVFAAVGATVASWVIGTRQVRATLTAVNEQLAEARSSAAEQKRAERRNLAYLLNAEANRIKMEADERLNLLRRMYDTQPRAQINASMRQPYKIIPRDILVSGGHMPNLVSAETCEALIGLLTAVDLMNSHLEIRTQLADYVVEDFKGALITVSNRADAAIVQLVEETRK